MIAHGGAAVHTMYVLARVAFTRITTPGHVGNYIVRSTEYYYEVSAEG